jgi:CubicO group peptidase (beta-lactamase class C family)
MVQAIKRIDSWPVPRAAAAVIGPGGVLAAHGATTDVVRIASVAKLLTAHAVMVAVEEGIVALDQAAGPPGATLRHLLAHASGYGFESDAGVLAAPGTRRIYSNRGIEEAAALVADAAAMPFAEYLREAVLDPLGMTSSGLRTSAAFGVWSCVDDLARFVGELFAPRLVAPSTLATMVAVQFPGLAGVLPGVARYDPLDWGLGFERNFARPGHWAGREVSARTFGHFGGSGTFVWVDPVESLACVALTDREFGPWAMEAWPPFSDAVVTEHRSA